MGRCLVLLLVALLPLLGRAQMEKVSFSHPGGFYEESFTLELQCQDPQHRIFYTTNGATPTADAHPYLGPMRVDERLLSTSSIYRVAIATDDMMFVPDSVRRTVVIRAAAFDDEDRRVSEVVGNTYLISSMGVDTHGLPVLSICADSLALFDADTGILVPGTHFDPDDPLWSGNYYQEGREWERLCNVEFYELDNTGFNQRAGLRTQGNNARRIPQKGLKLYARKEYGEKQFKHKLFAEREATQYKRLVVKPFCDPWSETCITDYVCNKMAQRLRVDALASRPAVVFLNGEYWGIYYLREKPDERYLEWYYDVDPDDCDIISSWEGQLDAGDSLEFLALRDWVQTADLSDSSNYAYLCGQIDLDNFIDYQLFEIFIGNKDWPGNNMRCWKTPGRPWRWIFFDGDAALLYGDLDVFANATCIGHYEWPATPIATLFLRKLLENQGFVELFVARFNSLLSGALCYDSIHPWVEEIRDLVREEVPAQIERFDHPKRGVERWLVSVEHVDDFLRVRSDRIKRDMTAFFAVGTVELGDIQVFPNPFVDELTLKVHSDRVGMLPVFLMDSRGRLVEMRLLRCGQGDNELSMRVTLPSGLYFLCVGDRVSRVIRAR